MLAVLLLGLGTLLTLAGIALLCWPVALIVAGLSIAGIAWFVDLEKPEPEQ